MTPQPPSIDDAPPSNATASATNRSQQEVPSDCDVSAEALLELLGDDYTQQILQAVASQSKSAREIIDVTGVSKVTTYRRLNRLEEVGLVRSRTVFDSDGHHHAEYRSACDSISIRLTEAGIELRIQTAAPD